MQSKKFAAAADTILRNGHFLTPDEVLFFGSLAIFKGRILAMGEENEMLALQGESTRIIDLDGKFVLPGLIDSHCHPWWYGAKNSELNCTPQSVNSIEDILNKIRKSIANLPEGYWVRAFGYEEHKLLENRQITRWDLDKAAPLHPVYLRRRCDHMGVCNSMALKISGIDKDTPDPPGGAIERDPETGNPTGVLKEAALNLVRVPKSSVEDIKNELLLALNTFTSLGVTTLHDAIVFPELFQAYQELAAEERLPVRVRLWLLGKDILGSEGFLDSILKTKLRSGLGGAMLKIMGVKFMLDGGITPKTAALMEAYVGEPNNKGLLYFNEEELGSLLYETASSGLRSAIHVVGERAVETAICAFEIADRKGAPIRGMRNRLEHCALLLDDHYRRIKELNLCISLSSTFIYSAGDLYKANVGAERMQKAFSFRSLIDNNIPNSAHSDCPMCGPNPLEGIYASVTRTTSSGDVLNQDQSITVKEAVKSYTYGGAYFSFEENDIGTIAPGMLADFTVLDEDITDIDPARIKNVKVKMTFVDGRLVFDSING